jgi:hypothetical protein
VRSQKHLVPGITRNADGLRYRDLLQLRGRCPRHRWCMGLPPHVCRGPRIRGKLHRVAPRKRLSLFPLEASCTQGFSLSYPAVGTRALIRAERRDFRRAARFGWITFRAAARSARFAAPRNASRAAGRSPAATAARTLRISVLICDFATRFRSRLWTS